MLHCAQHDKTEDVIPSVSEESSAWMLRFAQHDKLVDASLRNASFSMTAVWSFRTLFFVIPNACEESTYGCFASLSMTNWWMLRFIQHDKGGVVPHALFCHSERERGIHCMDIQPLTEKNAARSAQSLTNTNDQTNSNARATDKD